MQPFVLLAFLAVGVASTAISAPVNSRDIASCEVGVAAQQVACIDGCAKDASCITACTAVAVDGYTKCAGA